MVRRQPRRRAGLGVIVGIFTDTLAISIAFGAGMGLIVRIVPTFLTRDFTDDT